MRQIVDGNIACSNAAYLFSEFASIYPITPSSPMASNMDFLSCMKKICLEIRLKLSKCSLKLESRVPYMELYYPEA